VFLAGLLAGFGVGVACGEGQGLYPVAAAAGTEGVGCQGDVGELGQAVVGFGDGAFAAVGVDDLVLVADGVVLTMDNGQWTMDNGQWTIREGICLSFASDGSIWRLSKISAAKKRLDGPQEHA